MIVLACAASASAHPTGTYSGFVSTVSGIEPPQPGLLVAVLGGHERLSVRNLTQKTVVVFDEHDRQVARLAPGQAGSWADPRISHTGPPPEREGLVKEWRIPGEADGEAIAIVGFLGYRPPPDVTAPEEDNALPTGALALAIAGGALVLAAVLALPLRRRKGEDERGETATER